MPIDPTKLTLNSLLVPGVSKLSVPSVYKAPQAEIRQAPTSTIASLASKLPPSLRQIGQDIKESLVGYQSVDLAGEIRFKGGLLRRGDPTQQQERAFENIIPLMLFRPKNQAQRILERNDLLRPLVEAGTITEQRADEVAKDVLTPIARVKMGLPEIKLTKAEKLALRPLRIDEYLDQVFSSLDLVSMGTMKPLTRTAVQKIAKSKIPNEIFKILKKEIPDLTDDTARVFSNALVQIDNADDVQRVINRTELALQEARKTAPAKELTSSTTGCSTSTSLRLTSNNR